MSIACSQFVAPSSLLPFNSPSPGEIFFISFRWPFGFFFGVIELGEALEILFFFFHSFYDVPGSLLNVLTFNIWLVPFFIPASWHCCHMLDRFLVCSHTNSLLLEFLLFIRLLLHFPSFIGDLFPSTWWTRIFFTLDFNPLSLLLFLSINWISHHKDNVWICLNLIQNFFLGKYLSSTEWRQTSKNIWIKEITLQFKSKVIFFTSHSNNQLTSKISVLLWGKPFKNDDVKKNSKKSKRLHWLWPSKRK